MKKRKYRYIFGGLSVLAIMAALPFSVLYFNKKNHNEGSNESVEQLSQISVANLAKQNKTIIANNGKDNLFPTNSVEVSMPNRFIHDDNLVNWVGNPKPYNWSSSLMSSPEKVNLNVYEDTKISVAYAINKEFIDNFNNSINFYWSFLGNEDSPGSLKNSDEYKPNNRGDGIGYTLPKSWMENKLYDTKNGKYLLISEITIPAKYASYFYNDHQVEYWYKFNRDYRINQYFNFVMELGHNSTDKNYTTDSVNNRYKADQRYITRVLCDGISAKKPIQFNKDLESTTDYVENHQIKLSIEPFNTADAFGNKKYQYNYKYQWYKDGVKLTDQSYVTNDEVQYVGSNTNTLTIVNPNKKIDGSDYYCQVVGPLFDTGYDGDDEPSKLGEQAIVADHVSKLTTSNITKLNLLQDFEITDVSVDYSSEFEHVVQQGDSLTWTAKVNVSPIYEKYLELIWKKDGKVINNKSNTITFDSLKQSDSGLYSLTANLKLNGKVVSTKTLTHELLVVESTKLELQKPHLRVADRDDIKPSEIYIGDKVELSANPTLNNDDISNHPQISYQWYKDDELITNQNQPILKFDSIQPEDTGSYNCVVKYNFGKQKNNDENDFIISKKSPSIILNIDPIKSKAHIVLEQDLENVNVDNGESTSLEVKATIDNNDPLIYEWFYSEPQYGQNYNWQKINLPETTTKINFDSKQTLEANGYYFACLVTDTNTNSQVSPISTNAIKFNVKTPTISIVNQPILPTNVKIGSNIKLWTVAEIDNLKKESKLNISYQWMKKVGDEWNDVVGQNQEILDLSNIQLKDSGTSYKCKMWIDGVVNPESTIVYTKEVMLNVSKPTLIETSLNIHGETNISIGQSALFSINPFSNYGKLPTGYHYTYQWQHSTNNKEFINLENQNESVLNLGRQTHATNNDWYQCIVSIVDDQNQVMDTKTTESVVLNVQDIISVNIQLPNQVKTHIGGQATIEANVDIKGFNGIDTDIKYQWKYIDLDEINPLDKSVEWKDVEGGNKSTLELDNVTKNDDNKYFSLSIEIFGNEFTSAYPTHLTVFDSSFQVKTDNLSVYSNIADTVKMEVEMDSLVTDEVNLNPEEFNFQWYAIEPQVSENDHLTRKVEEVYKIRNGKGPVLELKNISKQADKAQFYCVVSSKENPSDVAVSSRITLNVNDCVIDAPDLQSAYIVQDGTVDVSLKDVHTNYEIQGDKYHFRWEYKMANSDEWVKVESSTDSNEIHLKDVSQEYNGTAIRCVITYGEDAIYTTNSMVLVIENEETPEFPDEPDLPDNPDDSENQGQPDQPVNPDDPSLDDEDETTSHVVQQSDGWIAIPVVTSVIGASLLTIGLAYFIKTWKTKKARSIKK